MSLFESSIAQRRYAIFSRGEHLSADQILALDVMLSIPAEAAQSAVRAALPGICAQARDHALFSDPATEDRSLVALRALALG